MAGDEGSDDERASSIAAAQEVDAAQQDAPADEREQAVRYRIVREDQRVECARAGADLHTLDAREQEDRPEEVGELRGGHQPAGRRAWSAAFRRERNGVVAQEHRCVSGGRAGTACRARPRAAHSGWHAHRDARRCRRRC